MKNFIFLFLSLLFIGFSAQAQTPEKFNYQGIARNTQGEPMASQDLGLKISIINGSTAIYSEVHQVTTNNFGLYTLAIGDGTPVSGAMASVGWSTTKLLKVEIDPYGGTNYTDLGTTELLSVPYAMYAVTSGGIGSPTGAAGGDLTGTYPNPNIANDVVNTAQLSNNAVKTLKIFDGAITASKLDDMGAISGQFLKFDGTNWVPDNVTGGGTADDWGAQVIENTNRLSGNGTAANPLDIAQQGASSGQVLKWNGTNWVPANDETGTGSGSGDDWGAQVAATDATIDGEGTTAAPLGLADASVTGEKINQMSATNGQILKWNGTTWEPADDETGTSGGSGGDWGAQVVEADSTLDGDGTAANPLGIADGAITSAKINDMSATSGQVLKFDGTNWVPGTDDGGTAGATYTAGDGIAISGSNEITADLGTDIETSELQDAAVTTLKIEDAAVNGDKINQMSAANGQVLKWNGTTWEPADDETGTGGGTADDWGAQVAETNATLDGDGTAANPLAVADDAITSAKINDMSATSGQVLTFDGTSWVPDNATAANAGWALDGNAATPTDFIGTTNDEALRFKMNGFRAGFIKGNIAYGLNSLSESSSGIRNTAIGNSSLNTNTTGERNTAVGSGSLSDNTTGSSNIAVGDGALSNNENGNRNTAIGGSSLLSNVSGTNNTATGAFSLNNNTSGFGNTAMGRGALSLNDTGRYNTAIGLSAFNSNTIGEYNSGFGYNTDVAGDLTNATAIGANALVAQDNSLVLGSINGVNNATADTKVGIGTTTPDVQLDISGGKWDLTNTEGDLRIGNDTHRLKMSISTGGAGAGNGRIRAVGGTDKLLLGAGTEDVLSVVGNGRVGINNENPDEELVIGSNLGAGWTIPAATIGDTDGGAIEVGNTTTTFSVSAGSTFNRSRLIASDANGFGEGNIEMRTRQLSVGIDAGVDETNAYPLRIIQSGGFGMYLEHSSNSISNWELWTDISGNLNLIANGSFVGNFDETSGNYTSISDRRLKTNIVAMPSVSEKLLQLDAKNYNYKSNLSKKYNGFLAQDIQKLFPEIITEIEGRNPDEISVLTVDYVQLTVLSIKAIQEQQEIIETQTKELKDVCKKLDNLEARLLKLEKQ
ncbi:tail fiber domain-containing protein [Mesonia ostreae]|uniref:Tail fiber domain-containing protein n=1 Tax=Mesonia ostreae TaxID=861110 RepID=A0ABU2KIY0_9FLAO|nr:tail fiber domain-containing protein [Mesonia ostreae]MDT0294608.1 tail fiber domain-containing protein [Mesonia ostreae]